MNERSHNFDKLKLLSKQYPLQMWQLAHIIGLQENILAPDIRGIKIFSVPNNGRESLQLDTKKAYVDDKGEAVK